uniref:Nuclease associated modular domain-containing protein n=1 Tax=Oryza brachyantha TaxID=4533 RepID=J3MA83_ORYBR
MAASPLPLLLPAPLPLPALTFPPRRAESKIVGMVTGLVIMEIPLELMLTITQKRPWMFFPDIIPLGHPIFDIIESTDPEPYSNAQSSTRKRDMKKLVQDHSPCQPLALQSDPDITILPIKEIERRRKIGAANKGKVPWTNGRKLSKEHKALIKQRTTEALRDPKVMSC